MLDPMLIHIPHASIAVPRDALPLFAAEKLPRELAVMTDWYCDELFAGAAPAVVFPVSRLVCDPERFREDADEPMAARGMGAVYERCSDGSTLRILPPGERERILARYYDPHHAALAAMVRRRLEERGRALIIDAHSFFPVPLPHEPDQTPCRPDFCIGTDPFHTPRPLAEALCAALRRRGYTAAENRPFAGSLVPLPFYGRDRRVQSVMIEVNRALYLTASCRRAPGFWRTAAALREALVEMRRQFGLY